MAAEVVNMLVTVVEWCLGVFAWITDSLYEMMNDDELIKLIKDEKAVELAVHIEKKGLPVLQLVLASSSRAFLLTLCRRLTHLEQLGDKAFGFYQNKPADPSSQSGRLRSAYLSLHQASHKGKVRIRDFEGLLKLIGKSINQTYDAALPRLLKAQPGNAPQGKEEDEAIKALRIKMETHMILAGAAPPPFLIVIRKILHKDLPAFKEVADPAELFFATFSVIDVQEEEEGPELRGHKTMHLDALSKAKVRIEPTKQWRRCTRCTAVMEEAVQRGPGWAFVVNSFRRCMCGGTWALLPNGQMDF